VFCNGRRIFSQDATCQEAWRRRGKSRASLNTHFLSFSGAHMH